MSIHSLDSRQAATLRLLNRLATLPAHQFKNLKPEDPRTLMLRTPGLVDGKYLSMRILVQNRTKGTPMGWFLCFL
jgi:hypothetical protein